MALFAIWHDDAVAPGVPPARLHRRLLDEAHIVPERVTQATTDTPGGCWRIAAFACASHFYSAEAQVWRDPAGGACIIHGLIWRSTSGQLLDAAAVAALLDRPGARLPDDVAGEYAVARLHRCGTLEAFADEAGLHQIFHRDDGRAAIASRAGFLAALAADRTPDREAALWLSAIGYRVGPRSAWRGVAQLAQGHMISADAAGARTAPMGHALALPPAGARGFAHGGADLLEQGLAQAKTAVLLAAADAAVDLPITGGKDSRVVLAIALAAGLRDRLTVFTRGYAGHPDVRAGQGIAAALGLPHRREPPRGSDAPADLSAEAFVRLIGTIAYQADGGIGGWDNISGTTIGRDSLISGHMGELLKAYRKDALPGGVLDPVALMRLQAPFDPLELLRPAASTLLEERLAGQMAAARAAGAGEGDLPDLFYWQNRVPNWLGGIRGITSFERQPVLPLGVPALLRLALTMTPEERKTELAHVLLIERAAPELLPLPFAHQSWDGSLRQAPSTAPIVADAGTALFGSWQWSLNRNPAVRTRLAELFAAVEVPLWEDVDRARLLTLLRERRFDYRDAISLLGLAVAAFHQAGLVWPVKLGPAGAVSGAHPSPPALLGLAEAPDPPARLVGHLDGVDGAARREGDMLIAAASGTVRLDGWLQAPDWPGAGVAVEARVDGRVVASAAAERPRADLAAAGIGDGRYGFTIELDAAALRGGETLVIAGIGGTESVVGGRIDLRPKR